MIFSSIFEAMFYLGSIAGILPYLLAFSLTIVWGGHAGLPFFTSASTTESQNEIVEEKVHPVENSKSFSFDNQIVVGKITAFLIPICPRKKVFNFYLFRSFHSTQLGIALLRAPPVSLF